MLKDAFFRALQVADIAGLVAVIVDAKKAEAKVYYQHKRFGFEPMPGDPMRLFLPIRALRASWDSEP